jgi:hypothetical protein
MHPAFSILFFTTLAGAAQGLLVALALAQITGVATDGNLLVRAVGLGVALLLAGLAASFLHLGHKMRAYLPVARLYPPVRRIRIPGRTWMLVHTRIRTTMILMSCTKISLRRNC